MAYLSSGASPIIYARQYRHSGSKAFPAGIVATKSKLEMRPLWDSDINHRISKHQLRTWTIVGVKKKESVDNIVAKLKGVGEKPMSTDASQSKYDVFVSFRGEDIRDGFLSHLIKAFPRNQINAFVDEKLKRGDDISHSLFEAIEGSSISLVIFSENYASSHWCLQELVKIIECKEKNKQIVIPVFYGVRSTDVRNQNGSYETALNELKEKYNSSQVQKWKDALKKSTSAAGIKKSEFRNDAQLLEEITKVVLMNLGKYPINSKKLIGIDKPIAHLKSMLKKESEKVRVIGIWGMGGIGKSTIVEELLTQNRFEYDGCCFLEKVSKKLKKHGMKYLKENLFSDLLAKDVKFDTPNRLSSDIVRWVGRMKVLIVLDDVRNTNLLEMLFGNLDWFRPDSRIIVTSRDRKVLTANEVDDIYKVGVLSSNEALELFNLKAFKQNNQLELEEYHELSKRFVKYAGCIPLVLEILGSHLRGSDKEVWESQLDKLKREPIKEVNDVMILSYDDLDRLERKIFLDIACFFNGLSLKVDCMKLLLKDYESDNSVVVALERLKDKALITISEDNVISMHDILQEIGREVVRRESSEDPCKRSRLWDPDEICDVLKNDKGTDAIRSICLDLSSIRNLKLSPRVFAKMTNLKFLDFYGRYNQDCLDLLPQGLQSFSTDLRYLHWVHYPLKSLPENFSAKNLVILDLSYSLVEKLWCGVQELVNLKEVKLSFSEDLKELPDFSKAINLKVLNIQRCYMLTSVHPSIFSLDKLETLELRLIEIESIPSSIKDLTRLRKLDIRLCSKLVALPELPSSLETLLVECRSLKTVLFPSTVAEQFKENKKRIEFWNCFKLDECSLINIGLNLQINLMEFAYQHLSTPEHDKVESYVDYKYNFDSYQAAYVYPGSSVPEWLEYKTTKDNMIIDLSPPHLSPLLGFVFCFILAEDSQYCDIMEFNISTFDGEGDGKKDGVDIYMYRTCCYTELDHVCMIYDQPCSHYLTSIAKNQTEVKIKVTARTIGNKYRERTEVKLKGFGISPISRTIYDNFVGQMELFDHINRWKRTVLIIILCISLLQLKMKKLI